jgi:hypothetical protein
VVLAGSPWLCLAPTQCGDCTVPSSFSLLRPADGDSVTGARPVLTWRRAHHPDPTDTVAYTTYWSSEPSFAEAESASAGQESVFVFRPDVLRSGALYHWRVLATDTHGASTWSAPVGGRSFHYTRGGDPAVPAIEAEAGSETISLAWTVPDGLDLAKFLVYRREAAEALDEQAWTCISPQLVPASNRVRFVDDEAEPGVLYEYMVEAVEPAGAVERWGPVQAQRPAVALFLRVFPSPGDGGPSLRFGMPRSGPVDIRVFNAGGREIARSRWAAVKGGVHDRRLPGTNGEVVMSPPDGGLACGTYAEVSFGDSLVTWLRAGELYLQIRTRAHPDGEVRGQLVEYR